MAEDVGARRSRRFNVRIDEAVGDFEMLAMREVKRHKCRAPLTRMDPAKPNRRSLPSNRGLMELIRAKRAWDWKPSIDEIKKGFRGWHQRGYLPHCDASGVTQFITFQLHDSFPIKQRVEWESILRETDDSTKRKKLEARLDRGYGECWLQQPSLAELVEKVLLLSNGDKYWVQSLGDRAQSCSFDRGCLGCASGEAD
jgi:hypothetical protein